MTQEQKIIRAKVGLLELAKQLGNVSHACKMMGYSRDSFYRFKELYDKGRAGVAGDQPAQTAIEEPHAGRDRRGGGRARDRAAGLGPGARRGGTEAARVVDLAGRRALRVAAPRSDLDEASSQGARSQGGAGRHPAHRDPDHRAREGQGGQRSSWRVRKRVPRLLRRAGHLLCRNAQGRGRVYQQTFIDTYAKVAFAKLYDRKTPITAAEILNDRVVPFYDEHGIRLSRVLTDRGTEFCGTQSHEYELYLAVEDIDHSRTKTKSPQTNGICERFHRTVLDEFYRIAFRKKIYHSSDELQADLDAWLLEYNYRRPHQGRWCFGKTPMQTFLDAIPLAKEKLMAA